MARLIKTETDPYCSECGYILKGLTDSSKCPECGKPIVEVLVRDSFPGVGGYRYETRSRIGGWPLVSIALGARGSERVGKPVGIIAIGDKPRGIIAIGQSALGVVAIGGFARGVLAIGGFALGVLGFGGFCAAVFGFGGFVAALYAYGGSVIPFIKGVGGVVIDPWPW